MANETMTLSAVVAKIASKSDQEPAVVAKKLRSRIRNNFDDLAKQWPGLEDAKTNRDGNRYPPMPRELAQAMIDGTALPKADKPAKSDEDKAAKKAKKKAKKAKKQQQDQQDS